MSEEENSVLQARVAIDQAEEWLSKSRGKKTLGVKPGDLEESVQHLLLNSGVEYLGFDSIHAIEDRMKHLLGIDIRFIIDPGLFFPFNSTDLEIASKMNEVLILRPSGMLIDEFEFPLNLQNLEKLFKGKDPLQRSNMLFLNNLGDSVINQDFGADPDEISCEWVLVKKDYHPNLANKRWGEQNDIVRNYGIELAKFGASAKFTLPRTAVEAAWDTLAYYTNTGVWLPYCQSNNNMRERLLSKMNNGVRLSMYSGDYVQGLSFDASAGDEAEKMVSVGISRRYVPSITVT